MCCDAKGTVAKLSMFILVYLAPTFEALIAANWQTQSEEK